MCSWLVFVEKRRGVALYFFIFVEKNFEKLRQLPISFLDNKKDTKMPRKKSSSKTQPLPFIENFFKLSKEEQQYVTSVIHLEERDKWEGHHAVPPASVLDDVLWSFERHTAIPLELPFVSFMTILSGFLCTKGVRIKVTETQSISPKIWVVGLANSGSSKSFTIDRVARLFCDKVPFLKSTASGVALLEALSETPCCFMRS